MPYLLRILPLGISVFLASIPMHAAETEEVPAAGVDQLSAPQIEEVTNLLKSNYLDSSALEDVQMKRAALEGIIARLGPGAELLPAKPEEPPPARPAFHEMLENNLLYFRLGSLDAANIATLDESLTKGGKKLAAVVLDLRNTPASTDYEAAAEVVKRFIEKGKPLFQIRSPKTNQVELFTSNTDALYTGLIMIVTNPETRNAAEAIAATLRRSAPRAMIVGATTAGQGVEFAEFQIPGAETNLRVAVAQVELPSGETLFPKGIEPDIDITMDPEVEKDIFARSVKSGVKKFIVDAVRARMNEAALVTGTNPEIEELLRRSNEKNLEEETYPRDVVLQRAVDVVTTVSVLGRKK